MGKLKKYFLFQMKTLMSGLSLDGNIVLQSQLCFVDLAGSEGLLVEDATGEHITDLFHVTKSLSALGDVLSSLTSKKEMIPYENSRLTRLLEDSIGGSSKTLLIVNFCPNTSILAKTLSALTFSARDRSVELNIGNRETIKKWRSENLMLSEKHKIEKDQNTQLRNQVAHILQLEEDQKIQIQERDSTIQVLLNIRLHICKRDRREQELVLLR
ncbi:hypothetical protein C5167_044095 [Papaver somniferum]|uniref:Kinesin motor domain-containing protein n=1 Tax=Papaver somniferum TaxID=3469 RepID=A0A4Y7L8H6_PAPSO|nr:hypothetical protein C5167_044095 [Papaver somniferum]